MCKAKGKRGDKDTTATSINENHSPQGVAPHINAEIQMTLRRRGKRDKQASLSDEKCETIRISRFSSALSKRHGSDTKSGGIEAILPSFVVIIVLVFGYIAKSGFRGRSTVAGIDLGTTNSVICVQQQAREGGCTRMDCSMI
jgi:hypothetical protein